MDSGLIKNILWKTYKVNWWFLYIFPKYWKQNCKSFKKGKEKCEAARTNTMTGGPDLSFGFPWNGKIPYPHQATWSQPINMRPVSKRESIRGKLKSLRTPRFEKSLRKFGPIKLLCKHVTNLLKPATNWLGSPYKFV